MAAEKIESQKPVIINTKYYSLFLPIFTFLAVLSLETRHTRTSIGSIHVGALSSVLARIVLALVNVYKIK